MKTSVFSVAMLAVIALTAPAQAFVHATSQDMHFVAKTSAADGLQLCHIFEKQHFLGLGIRMTSLGYALSPNCETGAHFMLSAERFAAGQREGWIPQPIPETPVFTAKHAVIGHMGWWILLLGTAATLQAFFKPSRATRKKNTKAFTEATPLQDRVAWVICQAVNDGGELLPEHVETVRHSIRQVTSEAITNDEAVHLMLQSDGEPTKRQFRMLAKGLDQDERESIMRSAFIVLGGNGNYSKRDEAFLRSLARGLRLDTNQVYDLATAVPAPSHGLAST